MTYDKVAGEGPYIHEHGHTCEYKCLACTYAEGRKAERERCLAIIERWRPMTQQSLVTVSDEIEKGGQDEK